MQDDPHYHHGLIPPRGLGEHDSPPLQGVYRDNRDLGGQGPETPSSPEQPRRKRKRQEPTSRADVAYLRKRAMAACRLCRSRKVKCNNARPSCSNCVAHEAPCVYEDSSENISTYDPASIAILDKLTQVLARLDELPRDLGQPAAAATATPQTSEPPACVNETQPASCQAGNVPAARHAAPATALELAIPAAQTSPEALLQWPILASGAAFPSTYIIEAIFEAEIAGSDSEEESGPSYSRALGGAIFNEDEVLVLVQRFLDHVHIKNPVLETETLWAYAKRVAEEGPKWDAPSCLVLLACALGSVAHEFPGPDSTPEGACSLPRTSLTAQAGDLRRGEGYFNLARRRLGLVQKGLLAPQCRFLAGVYLMYTMRPLQAWSEFQSASRSYHIYLQCQARRIGRHAAEAEMSSKRRRLEQRLYWSCYKSECELRAEMDLPNSSLASFHYPDMHPSPPDMDAPSPESSISVLGGRHPSSLNQFQEESWYYYLTEITLRRLANEILNAFYTDGHDSWNNDTICFMAKAARGFEQQLDEWCETLPSIILFEDHIMPTRELPYMVRGRLLEIQCCLYLPFLFYAIHNPTGPYRDTARPFVAKALRRQLCTLEFEPMTHRHHGTWYGMRSAMTCALCVLAAVRSGTIEMPGELDWRGILKRSLERMRYWADEEPSAARGIEVLTSYMEQI